MSKEKPIKYLGIYSLIDALIVGLLKDRVSSESWQFVLTWILLILAVIAANRFSKYLLSERKTTNKE